MIVAAWAERCSGPGWSNTIIWYLERDEMGTLRVEAIQPNEQTAEMMELFEFSEVAARRMLSAVVRRKQGKPRRKRP